jgi:hypothetical protein
MKDGGQGGEESIEEEERIKQWREEGNTPISSEQAYIYVHRRNTISFFLLIKSGK